MRSFFLIACVILLSDASLPEDAKVSPRVLEDEGGFSISPPDKWTASYEEGLKYRLIRGPSDGEFTPLITIKDEYLHGDITTLEDYVAVNLANLKKGKKLNPEESPFATSSGAKGSKLTYQESSQGLDVQQAFYAFEPDPGRVLFFACTCKLTQAKTTMPEFEKSIGSVAFFSRRFVEEAAGIKFDIPERWKAVVDPRSKRRVLVSRAPEGKREPQLRVSVGKFEGPVAEFASSVIKDVQSKVPAFELDTKEDFKTATNIIGTKAVLKNKESTQCIIYYFFEARSKTKITIAGACSIDDTQSEKQIDDAMKTFQITDATEPQK